MENNMTFMNLKVMKVIQHLFTKIFNINNLKNWLNNWIIIKINQKIITNKKFI